MSWMLRAVLAGALVNLAACSAELRSPLSLQAESTGNGAGGPPPPNGVDSPRDGAPNASNPGPTDPDSPPSDEPPQLPDVPRTQLETQVVDTLGARCSETRNLMPDLRRQTNFGYARAVASFTGYQLPRAVVVQDLPAQPRDQTITNVDFGLRVGRVFASRLIDLSERVVQEMDWDGFFQLHADGCTNSTDACREGFARRAFERATARSPSPEELDVLMDVYRAASDIGQSFEEASRLVTRSILVSPQFLFVSTDGPGPARDLQRAQRISMLLYNEPNHPEVLAASEAGELDTRAGVEDYVRSALRERKVSVGLEAFYYDWLNLDRLDYAIDRSNEGFEEYSLDTNDAMRVDLVSYLNALVFDESTSFVRAFEDPRAFLSDETAWIYRDASIAPAPDGSMVEVTGAPNRVGLLTQPAMLTLTLKIEDKSIVDRGVFVNEHILCRDIPLPAAVTPIDNTQFPEDASQREKLADHVQGPCAGCHVQLDAPGYALEMFGAVGEFNREDRYGNLLRDDGSFEIDGVESEFANVYEFSELLARSDELANCIVEKRLSHALARVVHPADDACELERLRSIFRESHYDLKELTVAIATSHYFMD